MANLPSPYDGDYPDDNIDLNLLNLDNAIDVYSIPDNVIIKNSLYATAIDSMSSTPITMGGTNASSITIGRVGITTTIVGMESGSAINLSSVTIGGESLLGSTSANPNFKTKGLKAGSGVTFGVTNTDITINSSSTPITLQNSGVLGTSLLNSTTYPDFSTKGLNVSTGLSIADTANYITLTNTLPSTLITLTSSGTGTSLLKSTTNPNFSSKGLLSTNGFEITAGTNDITLGLSTTGTTSILQMSAKTFVLPNSAGTFSTTITSGATSNHSLILPTTQGTASTFLQNNGSGALSWASSPNITYGENTSITDAGSIGNATLTDVPGSSFTLPSAGTWMVTYNIFARGSSGYVVQIYTTGNVLVANSTSTSYNGASIITGTIIVNTNTAFITTSASAIYKLRAFTSGAMTVVNNATIPTSLINTATGVGNSKIVWIKCA